MNAYPAVPSSARVASPQFACVMLVAFLASATAVQADKRGLEFTEKRVAACAVLAGPMIEVADSTPFALTSWVTVLGLVVPGSNEVPKSRGRGGRT